jgi:hypothetical protein
MVSAALTSSSGDASAFLGTAFTFITTLHRHGNAVAVKNAFR